VTCPVLEGDACPLTEPEDLVAKVEALKAEQARLKQKRRENAKELRNAERRKKRLKKRARQLSDQDLVAVLKMRRTAAAGAAAAAPPPPATCDAEQPGLPPGSSSSSSASATTPLADAEQDQVVPQVPVADAQVDD